MKAITRARRTIPSKLVVTNEVGKRPKAAVEFIEFGHGNTKRWAADGRRYRVTIDMTAWQEEIAKAIRTAVLAERRACLKVVVSGLCVPEAAILARGKP